MIVSAEVRWFWKEALPAGLETWFNAGSFPPGGGVVREDEYLLDDAQTQLGLKKRGGKPGIEIKGLVDVRAELPGPFHGRVQIWSKWTSNTLNIDRLPRIIVRKNRYLRKYDTGGSEVRELELDAEERLRNQNDRLPEHGCHMELVELGVGAGKARWWTFGLEAFGPLDAVEGNLRRTVAHVSRSTQPRLEAGLELSYPRWIGSLRLG